MFTNLEISFANNKSIQQKILIGSAIVSPLPLFVSQVLLGWKYGDCVDEKAKTHPQLRTYKALTEKVKYSVVHRRDNLKINGSWFLLCSQFLSLCFRRRRFTDYQLGTHWRACWWWAGALTEQRTERACLNRGRMRKWEKYLKLLRSDLKINVFCVQ